MTSPSTQLVPVDERPISEIERLNLDLERKRQRLRESLDAVQEQARVLTPAHQVRHSPIRWVLAAAACGFALGVLTAPRRR